MKINIHNFFGLDNFIVNCPPWMKYIAIGFLPYTLLTFIMGFGFELANEEYTVSAVLLTFYINGFCIFYSYGKS
jgi:hypothetical protein